MNPVIGSERGNPRISYRDRFTLLRVLVGVAKVAQRDQVELRIVTRVTSQLLVVNFQICRRATILTMPIIPFQHKSTDVRVGIRSKSGLGRFGTMSVQEA